MIFSGACSPCQASSLRNYLVFLRLVIENGHWIFVIFIIQSNWFNFGFVCTYAVHLTTHFAVRANFTPLDTLSLKCQNAQTQTRAHLSRVYRQWHSWTPSVRTSIALLRITSRRIFIEKSQVFIVNHPSNPWPQRYLIKMSAFPGHIAFDEYGKPFIILRDQAQQKRLTGNDAIKVSVGFS